MAKTYTAGISDGMYWNAGGTTKIVADTLAQARQEAEDWADEGDYPVDPPVTVKIVLRDEQGDEIDRWEYSVPDSACSGKED